MDLRDCWKKRFIRKVDVNISLAKSLIEMSKINEDSVIKAKINKDNISSYVYLAYESLREVLEAVCISRGYKVLSHVCLGELLNEILEDFDFNSFDRFRFIRNGIGYYGKKIGYEEGRLIIKKVFNMNKIIINKYLKNLK